MCVVCYTCLQTKTYLLDNVHVLLGKASKDDVISDVIPLLVGGLAEAGEEAASGAACRGAALAGVSVMRKYMDAYNI